MEISPELLLGIGGLFTTILVATSSFIVSRRSARKDEVVLLREEITRLQARLSSAILEVDKWRDRYNSLFNYVLEIRTIMVSRGIEIPKLEENAGKEEPNGEVLPLTSKKPIIEESG